MKPLTTPGKRFKKQPAKPKQSRRPAQAWRAITKVTRAHDFEKYLSDLILQLCRIDTTPHPEVGRMRSAERACFDILEKQLASFYLPGLKTERRPVNPAIQHHSNFSLLHFTKTPECPQGLSPEETYEGRSNLVCFIPGNSGAGRGKSVALNAHVDVVAPYIPPRLKGGVIYGRGACDDKGPVVAIVAALKVLAEVLSRAGAQPNKNITAMFVVEEETGGNGSLSLAIDPELKRHYDSILVAECTGLKLHPANRGAVWYRLEIQPPRGVSAFEMSAFINEALEKEGTAIRAESRHPLFPQRPVQTCHGIIGPFGEHPSRICGKVTFHVDFDASPSPACQALLKDCLQSGLADYVGLYGDKTQVKDPVTGKPIVSRHFDFHPDGSGFRIDVFGATGHMGAIRERDGAITKMAHLVRSVIASRDKLIAIAGGSLKLRLEGHTAQTLILEGGQGFVPTHNITEIMTRLQKAASRGAEDYLRRQGRNEPGDSVVRMTFEKLHNVAFDGDPDSETMRNALFAAKTCGLSQGEPVLGWTVSCDARLFATEHPGMDVITFGPGQLACAHSDREYVELKEVRAAVEFLSLFLLTQTGTLI